MTKQLTSYQRLEKLKIFLKFKTYTDFARALGLKSSQFATDLKRENRTFSSKLARSICDLDERLSYEWIMTGNGTMLCGGDTNVANNSNNTSATISVGNVGVEQAQFLSLYEKQQTERERLLSIIEQQQTQINLLITKSLNQ